MQRTIAIKSIALRAIKNYVHTKTFIRMFIEALFIIAKNWNQPKCPLTVE